MEIEITTGSAKKTTTGAEGGIDVSLELTIDGKATAGECTLYPCEDGRPGYESSGPLDFWLDGTICAVVRELEDEDRREALRLIEGECATVAKAFARAA